MLPGAGQGPALGEGMWSCATAKGRDSTGQQPSSATPALQKLRLARAGLPLPADTSSSLSAFPILDNKGLVRSEKQL